MEFIRRILAAEPVVFINLVAAVAAVLAVVGIQIPDATLNQIKDVIVAGFAFLTVIFGARQSVFSPNTHLEELTAAYEAGARDALPD